MKRDHYNCPLEATLDVIGGKWKLYLLWHLREETKRYGELKRSTRGITEKMLIQQLKQLEKDGIVTRTVYPEVPPRVEYSLTDLGKALGPSMTALIDWAFLRRETLGLDGS